MSNGLSKNIYLIPIAVLLVMFISGCSLFNKKNINNQKQISATNTTSVATNTTTDDNIIISTTTSSSVSVQKINSIIKDQSSSQDNSNSLAVQPIAIEETKNSGPKIEPGAIKTVDTTTTTNSNGTSTTTNNTYQQFSTVYIQYYNTLDEALDDFFFKKMFRYFKYELVNYDSKIGNNKKIYWLEVTNKLNKPIELAFVLVESKDGKVMISDFMPRDYLLKISNTNDTFFTKYIDYNTYYQKVRKLYDGQPTGSLYLASELRIAAVSAINSRDHGSADYYLTTALNVVGDNDIEYKAKIYNSFGLLYNNMHHSQDSINAMYQKAVDLLDSSYYGYYAYKGIIDYNNKNEKSALTNFQNALALHPGNFESLQYSGNIYLYSTDSSIQNCQKASEYFIKAAQVSNSKMRFELARSYICLGNYSVASKLLEEELIYGSVKSLSTVYYFLSYAYAGDGQIEKAISSYISAVKIDQNLRSDGLEKTFCDDLLVNKNKKCNFSSLDN